MENIHGAERREMVEMLMDDNVTALLPKDHKDLRGAGGNE